jgi:hypothetical protein
MRKSFMFVAVSAALAVAAFAASSTAQKATITVGDFAVKVAGAIGHPVTERSAAVESLRSRGIKIDDVNATLTEGMAAKILADLGLRVTPSSSNTALTPGKADQLVTMVQLSSRETSGLQNDLPTQCLALDKKECRQCCYTATSCDPKSGDKDCAKDCDKFCKPVKPNKPSPSEPLP